MATIYSAPRHIKVADFDPMASRDEWQANDKRYMNELWRWVKACKPRGKLVGEVIRFPVADGYAKYMVASLRPLELIHIPLGDAYEFRYANRLTVADVRLEVERVKAMQKLFARKI